MNSVAEERIVRQLIMDALATRTAHNGGFITRAELSAFPVGDQTRRLIDTTRGIWNPRDLVATLSVVSSPDGPYDDRDVEGGLFRYHYRAGSAAGDNTKLRRAAEFALPIILLRKIAAGVFVPVFPVYVVDDDVAARQFTLALDESLRFLPKPAEWTEDQRRYAERVVRQRLHQPEFRGRVIRAYATRCAICSLRHGELLDAAHITADSEDGGLPVVTNGLSLCKIHHSAYDARLLGISPDYTVHIDRDLLVEVDGPMLEHGIQAMHGRRLLLPERAADWPDRDRLAARFESFGRSA
jgi:putative restriction endonuclease